MDETYGTYVDDEYADKHDYEDDTDDDTSWWFWGDSFELTSFSVITHHYFNPVLFSYRPSNSAYFYLYVNRA